MYFNPGLGVRKEEKDVSLLGVWRWGSVRAADLDGVALLGVALGLRGVVTGVDFEEDAAAAFRRAVEVVRERSK